MVDQLRSFASEVTRVAREVGTEGKLGGQAHGARRRRHLEGPDRLASTRWRQPDRAGAQHRRGHDRRRARRPLAQDHGRRPRRDPAAQGHHQHDGRPAQRVRLRGDARRARGRHRGPARRPGPGAGRRRHLEGPHRHRQLHGRQPDRPGAQHRRGLDRRSRAATCRARSRSTSAARFSQLKETINTMVDQLNRFASEVTRVAREVGTEGKLGGQAQVPGVAGTWKDLTDNVNSMACNLTGAGAQHRRGDHGGRERRPLEEDHRGREGRDPASSRTPSTRWWTSSTRSPREVTRVAREVGTEGKLGGQAQVPGVAGTWKDLTDNVNSMASNLTAQVRNIAEVATAIAERRPVAQDHRRRARRDPAAEGDAQHDGRPAELVRRRGDARGARGRHRGQARRPGGGAGRRRAPGRT